MKKRFRILTLSMSLAIISTMVGCGAKQSSNSVNKETNEKNTPVVIKAWRPQPSSGTEAIKEIFDDFNKKYDGKIKVEYEFIPRGNSFAYEDKISSAVASKSLPDVLSMDGPNISNYAYSGIIRPLDEFFSKEELSDFVDSVITQGTYKGKLYALAPSESTIALFYNKKILDAAGIKPPTKREEAWTIPQFIDILKQVHKEGKVYGLNIRPDFGTGEWMSYLAAPFIWSNNGKLVSDDGLTAEGYLNGPAAVEGMKAFQEVCKFVNWQATPTEFEEERAAFTLSITTILPKWESQYPNLDWGVTYFPYNKTLTSPSGDWSWGISTQTKHPKEAAEFIKFQTNSDNVVKFARGTGKPPVTKTSFQLMNEWNEYPRTVLKEQIYNTAHPRPLTPAYPIISQEFAAAAVDIVFGTNVQERLDKAAQKIDENIKRNYK